MNSATLTPCPPPAPLLVPRLPGEAAHLPPGPRAPWWGIPLLRAMRQDYLGFTTALHQRYGDLTYMRLGAEHAYDLFTPELARAVLVDHADGVVRWERGMEIFEQIFGRSVLVTEGDAWKRQRRMLQPAFTPRKVAGYGELMVQAAQRALHRAVPVDQRAGLVDMDALFSGVTMDVILRTLFSSEASQEARRAAQATQVLSATAMREMFMPTTLPDWLPLPGKAAKRHALRTLRELVGGHIAARRARPDQGKQDLLAMLLALRDEVSGEGLSDQEVFDQCMVSFQAGHETSATALLWWSALMAGHPQALQRAVAEVDTVLQGREPGAADLGRLPWLTATLKEAMRLYPPLAATMSRRATRDIPLGQWTLPKGAMIRITPWQLQRDPRNFEAPDSFLPERFAGTDAAAPRAWMPFGTGPRVCIGQHFAMLEMTLVSAMLLQSYRLVQPADAPPLEPVLNVTLRPRHGLRLWLERR